MQQVRWLDTEEELLNRGHVDIAKAADRDTKTESTQEFHGFFDPQNACRAKYPNRTVNTVVEHCLIAIAEHSSCFSLVVNQLRYDDGLELGEEIFFADSDEGRETSTGDST